MPNEKLPFTAHLEELRRRLLLCLLAIGVGFGSSYIFSQRIFEILAEPLKEALPPGTSLIFTGLSEAFIIYLKVSFFAGICLASPVILYEIWRFVAPALYKNERRHFFSFVFFSSLLFVIGVLFGYFIFFPTAFRFFLSYASESVRPLPSIKEYLSFCIKLLLAFGVVFELPIFILFLSRLGIINAQLLSSQRKYAILGIFVVAAIITPTPDVVNQCLMVLPMILLYEIGILIAKIFGKKVEGHDDG